MTRLLPGLVLFLGLAAPADGLLAQCSCNCGGGGSPSMGPPPMQFASPSGTGMVGTQRGRLLTGPGSLFAMQMAAQAMRRQLAEQQYLAAQQRQAKRAQRREMVAQRAERQRARKTRRRERIRTQLARNSSQSRRSMELSPSVDSRASQYYQSGTRAELAGNTASARAYYSLAIKSGAESPAVEMASLRLDKLATFDR